MQPLIDNARTFGQRPEEFAKLAEGQSPQVLFITCSDSRVVPALITGARPGELFELRTAGNIVPPYASEHPTSEAATIEYAVEVLGVRDIVVCGHSHCGAVGALVRGDDLDAVPAVRDWLNHATPRPSGTTEDPEVAEGVQNHVLAQVLRLRSYPFIDKKLAEDQLTLHAWYYEVHTGAVRVHRTETDAFEGL
ncbi:carbonic anhydrase [Streptomyces sp. SAI-208]|uniref:carbonic anhydrase n=1 Tax=unclassified Streptomyces TaxID=2593676 RepID=UPI00247636C6|nr:MULTISPECIES: carbonic anhydrase [unclassified Streptomyces]MDH6515829.1 carbonic anhydrase [Streptomyces sp. SAI-090]MDH6548041.1 carbonic anhydrase [Streptomyces sp. SAI-041]MDH6567131.1 carbonic anhydrase [Streptomyces sp. SAI-117]MDH6587934.1 carbonic anhydrase [Streptomyces sp. SAI-133]MDH6606659.1 carbonic anhydrase [Streptomyces sp. SAI-208]